MIKKLIIVFIFIAFGQNILCAAGENNIKKDYLLGELRDIIDEAKDKTNLSDEKLYFLGLTYLKLAEFGKAREEFIKLTRKYPSSKYYQRALIKTADTYFLDGQYPKAKDSYNDLKNKRLISGFEPLFYLRMAQIYAKQGFWQDKNKFIQIIKEKYPNSPEYKYALILEGYDDFFSIQVGAFGSKANAEEVRVDLSKKYSAYISEDKNLYKVKVGKFKTRAEAERVRLRLLEDGYPAVIYP